MSDKLDILTVIHDEVKKTGKSVSNIYKILNGNGDEGLVTQVSKNTDHREAQVKKAGKVSWLWITTAFTVAAGIVLFVITQLL